MDWCGNSSTSLRKGDLKNKYLVTVDYDSRENKDLKVEMEFVGYGKSQFIVMQRNFFIFFNFSLMTLFIKL